MPRPVKCRKVCHFPNVLEFFPADDTEKKVPIVLTVDEYETIRLLDKKGYSQEQCAESMQIARTTVQRIYEIARKKIADALIDGHPLRIEGGDFRICDGQSSNCNLGGCYKQEIYQKYAVEKGEDIMRIAVTYENGQIFQHFGHTETFKIYDVEEGKVVHSEVVDTNGSGHGALAGVLNALNADVLICGGIGGGAQTALAAAGIKLFGGVSGDADKAVEAFINDTLDYNPDVFRGKTVLLPCDDPEWSNFTKYFAANFNRFGLKKLISTSYAKSAGNQQLTLFEMESPLFDQEKHETHGKLFTLTCDRDGSGSVDADDIEFSGYLDGDGDFRSVEVTALRDEADIIITNPPFSQFSTSKGRMGFLQWILEANKKFVILGNMNAINDKEVFPHLERNEIWLGYKSLSQDMYFHVTDDYKQWLIENKKEGSAYKIIDGVVMGRLASACWFTNIDHGKRHEPLLLDTMAHNLKYNKKLRKKLEKEYGKIEYPRYDNYDAIEVPFVECIPSDYDGIMGVPMTFMDRYDPEQFEILGRRGDLKWAETECDFYTPPSPEMQQKYKDMNNTWRVQNTYILSDEGIPLITYGRIFIQSKKGGAK